MQRSGFGIRFSVFGALAALLICCSACSRPAETPVNGPTVDQSAGAAPPAGGGGNTVAPMTTPVGGTTPVTGSVEGAGSGVGQAAKDMARKTATKASGS